jgi:hypothetical protein
MSSASVETASGGAHGAQQRDPISRPVTALLLFASLALAAGLGIVAADQVHKINEDNFSAFSQSATVFARNYAPRPSSRRRARRARRPPRRPPQ